MSGYLGSIRFGFPASMGAWAATQDINDLKGRKMVTISGDGGFGQYPMDFSTAVKYRMDFSHNLLYNGQLGKISKEPRSGDWPIRETDLMNPSFAAFAKLCGGNGKRVVKTEDISDAIQKAFAVGGPALVEIMTNAELV